MSEPAWMAPPRVGVPGRRLGEHRERSVESVDAGREDRARRERLHVATEVVDVGDDARIGVAGARGQGGDIQRFERSSSRRRHPAASDGRSEPDRRHRRAWRPRWRAAGSPPCRAGRTRSPAAGRRRCGRWRVPVRRRAGCSRHPNLDRRHPARSRAAGRSRSSRAHAGSTRGMGSRGRVLRAADGTSRFPRCCRRAVRA